MPPVPPSGLRFMADSEGGAGGRWFADCTAGFALQELFNSEQSAGVRLIRVDEFLPAFWTGPH